jgi:hypothetical protein
MIRKFLIPLSIVVVLLLTAEECSRPENKTAKDEQTHTEMNQRNLLTVQPPPDISWSLERDNLIKRFKLENDRTVLFYMYIFIEGAGEPIGFYQVNKISSVNSQLTNPEQIIDDPNGSMAAGSVVLPSPAEDGSYGSNGDGVFGFTPEEIYIEHNMKYIASTVPLHFQKPVNKLTIINVETEKQLKALMEKIDK